MWDTSLFDLDPNLGDPSILFDSAGFDYRIGTGSTGAIDVRPLGGVTTLPTQWETWRANAGPNDTLYSGTAVGSWFDWEERMWFLINLFRAIHSDLSLENLPDVDQLSGTNGWLTQPNRNRVSVQ